MSRCRSCQAEIRWVVTASGKRMPLDAQAVPNGNVYALLRPDPQPSTGEVLRGRALEEARALGAALFMPHHATCPDGQRWKQ